MPMHGFEITQRVESRSRNALDIRGSALYQARRRLEERELVSAEWVVTENNQRALLSHHQGRPRPPRRRDRAVAALYLTDILAAPPGPAL
jgi:hypothetical protein